MNAELPARQSTDGATSNASQQRTEDRVRVAQTDANGAIRNVVRGKVTGSVIQVIGTVHGDIRL